MPTRFDDVTRFVNMSATVSGGYGQKFQLHDLDDAGAICICGHFTGVVQVQVSNDARIEDGDDGWEDLGSAQTGTGDTYYYNNEAITADRYWMRFKTTTDIVNDEDPATNQPFRANLVYRRRTRR